MSAHVLQISDGTTTKSFVTGNDMALIAYEPQTSLSGENITETARVNFTSKTPSTNTTNINTINRLFEQARNYARTETGAKVYIGLDPGTSGTVWRSRVFNGKINMSDEVLAVRQYDQTLQLEIEWERQPFWEGALTAVPLTNASATDDTAGITITNCTDGGTAQVETATVVGTIDPAGAGNASFIVTAAGMTGSGDTTAVAVANDDTATQVATKAATAINLDSDITAMFNITSSGADLILTRLVAAADDGTMNVAYTNGTCSGLTPDATSADTVAGSAANHENWVSIKAAGVTGDLPAPIKLQMYNSLDADAADEIFVFHNVYSTPASLDHFIEGEAATGVTVTATPDATSCADFYGALTYTATTETLVATWAISTTELSYMAGGRFAVLARWAADFPYTNMWLRLKLESSTAVLWTGNLSLIPDTRQLHLLDTLRLPPYLAGQSALKGINMTLYALRAEAGAHTTKLDYLQLSPISGDGGWKRFLSVDNGVAYQEYFTHDDTDNITYRTDTSAKIIAEFADYGGPIMLIPNAVQKLYMSSVDYNGDAHTNQTWTVKLWYRPRRSSF